MALYRGSCKLAGLGKVPGTTYVTETEYNCLPSSKLTDGVNYGIYDDESDNTITKFIKNGCEYCVGGGSSVKTGKVDFLLIGGGGGGSSNYCPSGGGGGGFVECFGVILTESCPYGVTVGKGGSYDDDNQGGTLLNGGNTSFNNYIAYGGGGGGGCTNSGNYRGGCGGSGGGYLGLGCTGQGYKGSDGLRGGGGGAGEAGCEGTYNQGGKGGDGKCSCMSGELQRYSGGGGGGSCWINGDWCCSSYVGGCGGCGGGGNGSGNCQKSQDGSYYGGGGGGGYSTHCLEQCAAYGTYPSKGYQGIAIIRYKSDGSYGIKCASGGTITCCNGYTIHTFTDIGGTNNFFTPVFK